MSNQITDKEAEILTGILMVNTEISEILLRNLQSYYVSRYKRDEKDSYEQLVKKYGSFQAHDIVNQETRKELRQRDRLCVSRILANIKQMRPLFDKFTNMAVRINGDDGREQVDTLNGLMSDANYFLQVLLYAANADADTEERSIILNSIQNAAPPRRMPYTTADRITNYQ